MTLIPDFTPAQMSLLRLVSLLAWSDGELSAEELHLILSHLAEIFTVDEQQAEVLRQELKDYIAEAVPLENLEVLVSQLETEESRELALKLSYMAIQANHTGQLPINQAEKVAYRRLIELLGLPPETVSKIEWAADADLKQQANPMYAIDNLFRQVFRRH
jgi:uncharacterized tellurite resistance protein B-like protein